MIELADIFGYAGMVTGVTFMLPQVLKAYKTRSVEDISWGMLVIFFFNCIFWATYGYLIGALPIILTNLAALGITLILIRLKIRYWHTK